MDQVFLVLTILKNCWFINWILYKGNKGKLSQSFRRWKTRIADANKIKTILNLKRKGWLTTVKNINCGEINMVHDKVLVLKLLSWCFLFWLVVTIVFVFCTDIKNFYFMLSSNHRNYFFLFLSTSNSFFLIQKLH